MNILVWRRADFPKQQEQRTIHLALAKQGVDMDAVVRAGKSELSRQTRKIIRAAQRGQTVVIEHHGQPEVVVIDIADYRILRALARYYANAP